MSSVVKGPVMDLLNKPVPELSATSDMPTENVVEGPPLSAQSGGTLERPGTTPEQIAEEAKAAETAAAAAEEPKTEAVAEPAAEVEPKIAPKPKKGFQERIGEVTAERRAAEERATAAETARVAAEKRADAIEASNKEILARLDRIAPPVDQDPRPQRAQFDDPNKYDEALAGWGQRQGEVLGKSKAEQAFQAKTQEQTRKAQEDAQAAEQARVETEWTARTDTFKEANPDFEEVAFNPDVPIPPVVAAVLKGAENGPAMAYYLGQNVGEAKRIAGLPMAQQIMALGHIEAKLTAPPRTTKAPNPIDPLNTGANAAARKSPNEESMHEYAARRQQELVTERAQQTRKR